MIELTSEQRRELNTDAPLVLDPETRIRYVLVKEDVYERFEALLVPDRLTIAEQQAAISAAGRRTCWDDPEMDVYDRENPQRQP